jgi:serine/threonine protein kinase
MTSIPPRPQQTSRYYAPGEVIGGKYELIRPLGEGGMGSVWLASNRALDSHVALKLLKADLDAADAGERLLQEARAAARIGHRAIVRVFDFGHTEQGDPFIVMELLEGETLADVLTTRGRLTPIKSVQILLPVVDALSAAHARGIVHRDLKPENIFLVREQRRTQPKIVDFGIAKVEQQAGSTRTLTRQGTVLGSPGYMSPEQARGLADVDQRTDVWSVCVVLYECITGRPAFDGENYNALMRAIIEDSVVPSVDLAAGDASLWNVLERGLRKEPGERWPSMRALGGALAQWLLSHDVAQDVCGDPLTPLLDLAEPSGPRDILSVPPPSMLGGNRSGSATLNEAPAEPSREASGSKLASFRPGPESTSAVVQSARPARLGGGARAFAAGLVFLVVGTALIMRSRGTAAPAPAAGSAQPPAPHAVEPRAPTVVEVPAPTVLATPAPPSVESTAAPATTRPVPTKNSGSHPPARASRTQRRSVLPPPSDHSDLKDPY